ncbi:hypothetical protein BDR04DRAFT_1014521 [Suillus decipiens]|nr:hypothetical protein BDR04DRAFT_1014521 [Suillus decipiens]
MYHTIHPVHKISFANDSTVDAVGKGTVTFCTTIQGQVYDVELSNTLHMPAFMILLILVSKLAHHGLSTHFDASTDNCGVYKGASLVLTAKHKSGLYHV